MEIKPLVLYNGSPSNLKNQDSIFNPIEKFLKNSSPQRFYSSPSNASAISTASIVANTLYAMPFVAEKEISIDTLSMFVTTLGAGSNLQFGIYKSLNLYPTELICDSGQIPANTTGIKSYSLSLTLESALYFLVSNCSATAPIVRGFTAASLIPLLGLDANLTLPGLGYSINSVFGSLPNPFPQSATIRSAVPLPLIALHVV